MTSSAITLNQISKLRMEAHRRGWDSAEEAATAAGCAGRKGHGVRDLRFDVDKVEASSVIDQLIRGELMAPSAAERAEAAHREAEAAEAARAAKAAKAAKREQAIAAAGGVDLPDAWSADLLVELGRRMGTTGLELGPMARHVRKTAPDLSSVPTEAIVADIARRAAAGRS